MPLLIWYVKTPYCSYLATKNQQWMALHSEATRQITQSARQMKAEAAKIEFPKGEDLFFLVFALKLAEIVDPQRRILFSSLGKKTPLIKSCLRK